MKKKIKRTTYKTRIVHKKNMSLWKWLSKNIFLVGLAALFVIGTGIFGYTKLHQAGVLGTEIALIRSGGNGEKCTVGTVAKSYCSHFNRVQGYYTSPSCNYIIKTIKANDPTCGYKASFCDYGNYSKPTFQCGQSNKKLGKNCPYYTSTYQVIMHKNPNSSACPAMECTGIQIAGQCGYDPDTQPLNPKADSIHLNNPITVGSGSVKDISCQRINNNEFFNINLKWKTSYSLVDSTAHDIRIVLDNPKSNGISYGFQQTDDNSHQFYSGTFSIDNISGTPNLLNKLNIGQKISYHVEDDGPNKYDSRGDILGTIGPKIKSNEDTVVYPGCSN